MTIKRYKFHYEDYEMRENYSGEYVMYEDHLKEINQIEATRSKHNPCADALDWLWKEIILKNRPNYGDWEYPAQAYRHILAEYEELRTMYAQLKKELDDLNIRRMNPTCKPIAPPAPPAPRPSPSNVFINEGSQKITPSHGSDSGTITKGG